MDEHDINQFMDAALIEAKKAAGNRRSADWRSDRPSRRDYRPWL